MTYYLRMSGPVNEPLDWRNETLGARIRVALWLQEQGVGAKFKKQEIRAAIVGTEQVDRRMRDLRPHGLGDQDIPRHARPGA